MPWTVRADLLRECDPGRRWQETQWNWRKVAVALLDRPGTWAVLEYRLRHRIARAGPPASLALKPLTFVTRHLVEAVTGISIATRAEIGPGLFVGHFGGIVIGSGVRAGENLSVSHNVTIGAHRGSPVIGDDVYLAPGAKVFGPITLGDDVSVGANAVVHRDVPASSIVVTTVEVLPARGERQG